MELLVAYGYPGLFLASFAAATILPLSSEVVLAALLSQGASPPVAILIATIGNVSGSAVNYAAGAFGTQMIFARSFGMPENKIQAARDRLKNFGHASLLFAWVPIIGDPLTFAAGMLRINLVLFLILVTIGKCLRYIVIALFFY